MRRARIFSLIVALAGAFSAFSPSLRGSEFTRADTDASGALDISDAVRILGYLFIGEKAPPCLDAADSNDSGRVDIADATFILAYLFVGAKAPPPPFLACGADPTPDSLECDQFAICPDSSADRRPVIAHATASPSKLPRPAGDSVFASQIAWDFTDPDSDVETLVVTSIAPDGSAETVEWNAVELGIAGPSGTTVQQAVFTAASPLGSHERRLRLVDAEGNSSDEARVTILLTEGGTPRLDVTSIVPTSGTAGDEVTLRGNGLGEEPGATKVALGGAAADVIDEGIGWVRCQVPVNALTGPVQVSSPRGTAMSAVPFVIRPQVVIASASGGDDPLEPLEKRRFQAVVIGLGDRSVFWYTDGALGGSQASGFIAKDGTYTSPAVPPAAGVVTISCVAQADDSATAKTTLRLVPPHTLRGSGVVGALAGGTLETENGLAVLSISPGALASDAKLAGFHARLVAPAEKLPGLAKVGMPLAIFELESADALQVKSGLDVTMLLPFWTPPKTVHAVYAYDGKSQFVDTKIVATTGSTGTWVTTRISQAGKFALVRMLEAFPQIPPIQLPGPQVASVEAGMDAIEEGLTLPVLVKGKNFWPAFTRVGTADPVLMQDLEFGPVLVNAAGTQVGFTVRILPIARLSHGQTLPVSFRIARVDASGASVAFVDTNPGDFVIEGLPELLVAQNPASDVYTIDGVRIDRMVNDSARYSTLVVERGAALGIGRFVGSAGTADGFSRDLSGLDAFEESFGVLDWVTDRGLDRSRVRIFQPENRLVWLDVTGPVTIDGSVVFSGMRGGENASLELPSGPGVARLGGLASGTLSGGLGGDGGRTVGSSTRNGHYAGNGVRERGVGHGAGGVTVSQLVAAGFGARLDPQTETLDGLVNAAIAAVNPFSPATSLAQIAVSYAKIVIEASKLSTTASINNNPPENIVAGQGGHGGLRGTNAAPEMLDDTRILPGSGGGGGGGGGSSAYQATLWGFTLDSDDRVGGGGAGGGGAAGALRITTSSLFAIGPSGRFDGTGGRGGAGEPHRWTASPGGSGGGGAGGVVKLQATRFSSQGKVDVSGGERAAALLAQSTSPSPDYPGGRVQALQNDSKGGFLYYGCVCPWLSVGQPTVKLCWPTGRKRADITFSFLTGIRGIGTATRVFLFPLPNIPPAQDGLLILDDHRQVWFTGVPDYMASDPTPSISAMLFDLRTIPQLGGLTPTDITQAPFAPHNFYVSGVRGNLQDPVATSEVVELDISFQFVRTVFSERTAETLSGTPFIGHLRDIDFLSDGRLVGLMTLQSSLDQGIHVIDIASGATTLHIPLQAATRSMSAVRGGVDQFIVSVGRSNVIEPDGGEPPSGIEHWDVNGLTAHAAMALETISEPGVPGLVRVDGGVAGASRPVARADGAPLPNLIYDNQPILFSSPAIGSFAGPATAGLGLESLVFGRAKITAFCQGAEPGMASEIWRDSSLRTSFAVPTPPADAQGGFESAVQLDEGFNTLWVETNRGGATHDLLKRRVLYIENANESPPPPDR